MNISSAYAMKVILLTGATDGIGFEAAKLLLHQGHQLLLHGRNPTKLQQVVQQLEQEYEGGATTAADRNNKETVGQVLDTFVADLSDLKQVEAMANDVKRKHPRIDVLINNAGVFKTSQPITKDGYDVRFVVNTIAPYLLTKILLDTIPTKSGRIVNVSSAAIAPIQFSTLRTGKPHLADFPAYAQSKLGISMWTYAMSKAHPEKLFVSVNPASMLGSKMVREGFGVAGKPLSIGATILQQISTGKKYGSINHVSGRYFDNDSGHFQNPHPDATNLKKCQELIDAMESILNEKL